MQIERRFIFRGNASGVAAHILRPKNELLPVQAASSLPVIGGVSESKAKGRKLKFVSFKSASTKAVGDFDDAQGALDITLHKRPLDSVPTTTSVQSEVRGLRIEDRVKISLTRAFLVGHSPKDDSNEPDIHPEGNRIEGVYIDGAELKVTLSEDIFCKCGTYGRLRAMTKDKSSSSSQCLYESDGIIYCTLVKELSWAKKKPKTAEIDGHTVVVENFGTLYFGEIFISATSRRLTMFRARLGSPAGGRVSSGEVETNGSNFPA